MTANDLPTQPEAEPRHRFQPYKRTMYCGAPLDIYARCCRLEDHPVHAEPSKQAEPRRDDEPDLCDVCQLPMANPTVENVLFGVHENCLLKCLDAGYGTTNKTFFSLVQLGEKSFVHVMLSEGYVVYGRVSESECVRVNNALADYYEQGKIGSEAKHGEK